MKPAGDSLDRRQFLRIAAAGATVLVGGGVATLSSCDNSPAGPGDGDPTRTPLLMPATVPVAAASLIAAPGTATISRADSSAAWLFNGVLPGPTIRARQGEQAGIRLQNGLPEPTIVHWHGVLVPASMDGHPRHAIGPGASFDYAFTIVQRAGTFWYHPHPHHLTAAQIHRGLAGFFIISDAEEDALGLPAGDREVLLMLQDRDGATPAAFLYNPDSADMVSGMLRDTPYGNGLRRPTLQVSGQRHRFRILNASQARIYRLGLSDGAPLTVIGNDGGLLPAPVQVDSVWLSVGERADVLIDFAPYAPGTRLILKSLPFSVDNSPETRHPQGLEMDLLELVRTADTGPGDSPIPSVLSSIPALMPGVAPDREFEFRSTGAGDVHQINGLTFDMNRVDEQIPLGQVERWIFTNNSNLPHPVHLHGTHFQVEARAGGRNLVYPYEAGWKDTVLLMPLEVVSVLVQFNRYPGIFPLHCHNLQHEDMGMMLNVEVV